MNFIFLQPGYTSSIDPILTLIDSKPDSIVGCVLLGQDKQEEPPPEWFADSAASDNPAAELLEHANQGRTLEEFDIFLVVKESGSLLQLSVLAAVECCTINRSGQGGRGGKRVLQLLAKHNIRTYPVNTARPSQNYSTSKEQWKKAFIEAFESGFSRVSDKWLLASWGLPRVP